VREDTCHANTINAEKSHKKQEKREHKKGGAMFHQARQSTSFLEFTIILCLFILKWLFCNSLKANSKIEIKLI
jgi:hypothetical protein